MDEYAFIVENALGNPKIDIGPLDKMLALRKKLECKPFSWFMEQVYPTNIFKDPTEIAAISDVRNEGTNKCLDTLGHGRFGEGFGLYNCHGAGGSQMFIYMKSHKQLRPLGDLELCLLNTFTFGGCKGPDATWELTKEGYLLHPASGQCMSVEEHGGKASLAMVSCADNEKKLKWKLKFRSEFQHAKAAGPLRHDKQPHELANIVPL